MGNVDTVVVSKYIILHFGDIFDKYPFLGDHDNFILV